MRQTIKTLPMIAVAVADRVPGRYIWSTRTLWQPADPKQECRLQFDLGKSLPISRQEIRFEYAWKPYRCTVQASQDGTTWSTLADHSVTPAPGSPVVIDSRATARFLRLVFPASQEERATPAVFEWSVVR